MNITQTQLCVRKTDSFDILATETTTTEKDFYVAIHISKDNNKTVRIPLSMFRSVLLRLMNNRNDTAGIGTDLLAWLKDKNLSTLYERASAIDRQLLADPHKRGLHPETSKAIHIRTSHISKDTLMQIEVDPDYFHAVKYPYNDDDDKAWLLPVPGTMGDIPDDLKRCYLFADAMNASFIVFVPDGPVYTDIDSNLNIGDAMVTCMTCRNGELLAD